MNESNNTKNVKKENFIFIDKRKWNQNRGKKKGTIDKMFKYDKTKVSFEDKDKNHINKYTDRSSVIFNKK